MQQTMSTCGLLLWLTFGATALIGVYNLLGGIRFIHDAMGNLPFAPIVVVLLMMAVLIVLGMFMDWVGILLLTMPIFVPIIEGLGYDPVWFGILFCMNMQISYLSPPFGPAAFYLKSVAPPEISLQDIFRALWPFMLMQLAGMLLVMVFPRSPCGCPVWWREVTGNIASLIFSDSFAPQCYDMVTACGFSAIAMSHQHAPAARLSG